MEDVVADGMGFLSFFGAIALSKWSNSMHS